MLNKTLGALNDANTLNLKDGDGNGALFVLGAGLVGTVTFEGSIIDEPAAGDWFAVNSMLLPSGATKSSTAVNPGAGAYWVPSGGALTQVRARVSAYTSGSSVSSGRISAEEYFQFQ